ncbi:MAG TPA: hypothetical protein VFA04_25740 [Bryobacteraceae bacterium]|nr:hypothetical protein [Bryobacteraceae bacterium]
MSSIPRLFVIASLIVLPAAAGDEGQASGNTAVPDKVIDQVLAYGAQQNRASSPFRRHPEQRMLLAEGNRVPRVCSVPLLEMSMPQDKVFNTPVVPLPKEPRTKDVVPLSAMPAPPCPKKSK